MLLTLVAVLAACGYPAVFSQDLIGQEFGVVGALPSGEPPGCDTCAAECASIGADGFVYHQGVDEDGLEHGGSYGPWSLIGEDGTRVVFDVDGEIWTVFPLNSDDLWTVQTRTSLFRLDPVCSITSVDNRDDDDGA